MVLTRSFLDGVEDSFILLDALELDVEELQAGPAGRVVVEIGYVARSREPVLTAVAERSLLDQLPT
jgi:hypothetical protein